MRRPEDRHEPSLTRGRGYIVLRCSCGEQFRGYGSRPQREWAKHVGDQAKRQAELEAVL